MTIHRLRVFATIFSSLYSQRFSYGMKSSGNHKVPSELMLKHWNIQELFAQADAKITPSVLEKIQTVKNLSYDDRKKLKALHLEIGIAAHGYAGGYYLADDNKNTLTVDQLAQQLAILAKSLPADYFLEALTIKLDCCHCGTGAESSFAARLLILLKKLNYAHTKITIRAAMQTIGVNELFYYPQISKYSFFNKIYNNNYSRKEESLRLFSCKEQPDGSLMITDIRQIDSRSYIEKQLNKLYILMGCFYHINLLNSPKLNLALVMLPPGIISRGYKELDTALWYLQNNNIGIIAEIKKLNVTFNNTALDILVSNLFNRIKDSNPWSPDKKIYVIPTANKTLRARSAYAQY